jgi:hypothetical protein
MNMTTFKIVVSLVALFGLGAGSGYVVAKRIGPPGSAPGQHATLVAPSLRTNQPNRFFKRWSDARIAEYRELLQLSPDQETAMRGHFDALAADCDTLRADVRRRVTVSMARANSAIARDLTPEQRRLFWQHLREKAKRVKD